jgi:hypothetical protein
MPNFFRRSQYLPAIAMLLLATCAAWAQDNVVQITSLGQLIPNTNIQWSQLGGDQFQLGATAAVTSANKIAATVTLAGAGSVISVVCAAPPPNSVNCSWNNGFTAGDSLLWATNAWTGGNGPVTIAFASGIMGVGTFIQADSPGQFTASVQAYNGTTPLGPAFTMQSDAAGDPVYLGLNDTTGPNVTSVAYSLTACAVQGNCNDVAIDQLDMVYAPATVQPPAVALGTIVLTKGAQAGIYSAFRSRTIKKVLVIRNDSNVKLQLGPETFTVTQGHPANFSYHRSCRDHVDPGKKCEVALMLFADQPAVDSAMFNIPTSSPDRPMIQVSITATIVDKYK